VDLNNQTGRPNNFSPPPEEHDIYDHIWFYFLIWEDYLPSSTYLPSAPGSVGSCGVVACHVL